jgi:hypothetical protein
LDAWLDRSVTRSYTPNSVYSSDWDAGTSLGPAVLITKIPRI